MLIDAFGSSEIAAGVAPAHWNAARLREGPPHDVSILIGGGRQPGLQPRANTSMTIISTYGNPAHPIFGEIRPHGLDGIDAPESKQTCELTGQSYRCGAQATEALITLSGRRSIECV